MSQTSSSKFQKNTSRDFQDFEKINEANPKEVPLNIISDYYQKLGPDIMLDAIEEDKYCHNKGHNIGRVIFDKTKDLNQSLQICSSRCTTGCFHGVLMELFGQDSEHLTLNSIQKKITTICDLNLIQSKVEKGSCIHGMGHALMNLSDYDLNKALSYCSLYQEPGLIYYCVDGAYMERDSKMADEDIKVGMGYPCDQYSFAPACYKYKISRKFGSNYDQAISYCLTLKDLSLQHGCFHGLGYSYFEQIDQNNNLLEYICSKGDSVGKKMCIEGAIGVLTVLDTPKSIKLCESFKNETDKKTCLKEASIGNLGLDRDFTNYYILK